MIRPIITLLLSSLFFTACSGKAVKETAVETPEKFTNPVEFNADSAYSYIERQTKFGPRVPGTPAHKACAEFLRRNLVGADTVITQNVTVKNFKGEPMPLSNIMGRYNMDATKRVLLVAHWDSRPWADNDPDKANHSTPIDGANDGASGVGVILELTRLFNQQPPAIGVDILFVDGEDAGTSDEFAVNSEDTWCLGTQHWVNNTPYQPDRLPAYGILLDMVGGRDARFFREYSSELNARDINTKVWTVANVSGYGDRFINNVRGAVTDDHIYINRAGIPTIDIIECANPETGAFNSTWHTLDDNINNIDRSTLKAVGQTVANTIYLEK